MCAIEIDFNHPHARKIWSNLMLKGKKIDFGHLTMIEIDVSYPKVIEILNFGHSWGLKEILIIHK